MRLSSRCPVQADSVRVSLRGALAVFTLLFLAVALTLSSCTKKGSALEVHFPGQGKVKLPVDETLRIRIVSEPPSLDWHKSTDTTSAKITENTMEGLVGYDFSQKEPGLKPALATKWESADNKVWKFTLRPEVKWSDGKPLVPQHFVDGFKRLIEPATASEYAYFLYPIKNARAFSEGKIKDFSQVGVKISGPNEVTVELENPMSFFPYLLTHHSTFPIRLDVVAQHGDAWTEPGKIVTLGPYNMKAWEHDKQIVLERNPGYFGAPTRIKYVVMMMIQEATTAVNLFEAGKIDVMDGLPAQQMKQLKVRKEFRAVGNLAIYYYGFNVEKPPMNNPLIRKAINHAIDRQQVVNVLAGGQTPLTSFVPVGMFGYEASRGLDYNIEKAKALLKQAGYADPAKLPKIAFKLNTQENHQLVAENIQAQLKTNLGINMEIQNEEWKVFLQGLRMDPPQMYRFGWVGDYPDPDNFLNLMTSYSENNRTRWKNSKFDAIIEKAATESDREKRRQLYSEAQKILVEEDVPLVPLYAGVSHYLVANRVKNLPLNILDRQRLDEVELQ